MDRRRSASVLLPESVWDELRRQALFFGYPSGAVSVYLSDRLSQLADPVVMAKLSPPERSWPRKSL